LERALTAWPSRMLPNCFGPAGVARAPMPMEERSLAMAEKDAVSTVGFSRPLSDVDDDDDDDDDFLLMRRLEVREFEFSM